MNRVLCSKVCGFVGITTKFGCRLRLSTPTHFVASMNRNFFYVLLQYLPEFTYLQ